MQGFEPWMFKEILISRLTKISLCKDSVKNPRDPKSANIKLIVIFKTKIIKASKKLYFQTKENLGSFKESSKQQSEKRTFNP